MIKLKPLLNEISNGDRDAWRKDWLERHNAKFDATGRLIAYHATSRPKSKLIQQEGFRQGSYFSLNPEYSKRVVMNYHDLKPSGVVLFTVHLPLDAIDFVASDIVAIRPIQFSETI